MDFFHSVAIGIVEGFTEFLPISSTGHMIVAGKFIGMEQDDAVKAFEVVIQFAAILAVILVYRSKLSPKNIELWKKLITAFLPLGAIGFLFRHQIKMLFDIKIVAWMFIIGGIVFLIVEYFYSAENSCRTKSVEDVSFIQALWIGIAQIFSLIPGTSRAGATIVGGLLAGLDRKSSAEFSFLLAVPVMAAVSGYDMLKHLEEFTGIGWNVYAAGFVTAFIAAYGTIKLFLSYLARFNFVPFALYRIFFGVFLLCCFV